MAEVVLTGGLIALVDDDDLSAVLAAGPWRPAFDGLTIYARTSIENTAVAKTGDEDTTTGYVTSVAISGWRSALKCCAPEALPIPRA